MFSQKKKKKENEISEEEVKQLLVFSATRFQQDFYELLSDWNEYDSEKPNMLKNCIGTVLFGPPKVEENADLPSKEDFLFNYKPAQMKKVDRLYAKIALHGTQKDKKILCGLIYNVAFEDKAIKTIINIIHKQEDFNGDCFMNYMNPIVVFKVLKTTVIVEKDGEGNETKKDKIEIYFIDHNERVYKSWEDYLTNNILPPCIMVVPYNGEYQGDQCEQWSEEMSYVLVETHESPAYRKKLLSTLDTSSTVLSLGGMIVCGAALITPVGAVAVAAGGLALGVSSIWTIGRSSHTLIDRSKHEQSINITNMEGFTCWFGIASSALGVASAGGTVLLTRAVSKGATIGRGFQLVHDGIQMGTLAATGITAGISFYNIYDTYKETQTVSKQEVFNLIASLVVLGNSVIKFQFSKTLIENHQKSIIDNFESSLRSNRHRKEFKKMVNNTKSIVENPTTVREQIIRGINKIENKDDFFAAIIKSKKSLSIEGIKPAFVDGKFEINGKTLMNPAEFIKSLSNTPSSSSSIVPAIKPSITSTSVIIPNKSIFENAFAEFIKRHTQEFVAIAIPKITDFYNVLNDLSKVAKADVIFSKLLCIGLKIAIALIKERNPVSNIFARAVDFIWDYIKASIRESLKELVSESPEYREILMKLLINIYSSVERKLDEWVHSFKEYLKIKVTQLEDDVRDFVSSKFERINIASRSLLSISPIS